MKHPVHLQKSDKNLEWVACLWQQSQQWVLFICNKFGNTARLFVIQLPMVHRPYIMMGQHTSSQQPSYFHNLPSFRVPTYSLCRVGVDVNTLFGAHVFRYRGVLQPHILKCSRTVTNCKQFNMQIHLTSTMLVKIAMLISKIKQMFCGHACEM
jgi:hypothetical protein